MSDGMFTTRRFVLPLLAAALVTSGRPPLRVLRVTPTGAAAPTAELTVVFDRPVAGSLDYSVDPRTVLQVTPAIPGRVEWRDPITIRLVPTRPLSADTRYTVTVANGFHAMDGARLAEPYSFTFRVRGATLLAGAPADAPPDTNARFVAPATRFETVWSDAPDTARLARAVFLEMASTCGGPRVVRLAVASQRRLKPDDPWRYQMARVDRRDPSADSLRRVVTLAPTSPLPLNCRGELVSPSELASDGGATLLRWPFRTYGAFRVAGAECAGTKYCPSGPLVVTFTTPMRGADVLRHVTITPAMPFTVSDTASESARWVLDARLAPRASYTVVVDPAARDIFGQRLAGNTAAAVATTGFEPRVDYPYGRLLAERNAFRTLAVEHVNVDTLVAYIAPVPDSTSATVLASAPWSLDHLWESLAARATVRRIAVLHVPDKGYVTAIPLPPFDSLAGATLVAVKVIATNAPDRARALRGAPVALLQVTNLGLHARIGAESGEAWVTGVDDGRPRANAIVTLYDQYNRPVAQATTGPDGLARLSGYTPRPDTLERNGADVAPTQFQGYAAARLGDDRAVVSIGWDPDLAPWRFDMPEAYGADAAPGAAAVFTDRGIYRPGETVSVAAIVRDGLLGALTVPAAGDSVRWWCTDRDGAHLTDTTVALSAFGWASYRLRIARDAGLGEYAIEARVKRGGLWRAVGQTSYRVAEYRPPEFLVDLSADSAPHQAGDSVRLSAAARYLFGAPMAGARLTWEARERDLAPEELRIPGTDDYTIGDERWWSDDESSSASDGWSNVERPDAERVFSSGSETMDAGGRRDWAVALPAPPKGRGAMVTVQATVTDVNRQVVVASATSAVHPAAFYLAARVADATSYFWTTGHAVTVQVIAVRPDGGRVAGVAVHGAVVRHEWHQVRRVRDGVSESVGEWVSDTVGRCGVATGTEPVTCVVRPTSGGIYAVVLRAQDSRGRPVVTSLVRWASGPGFVPWADENRFKMDVIPDKAKYAVGDTATVMLASPITDAEGWITIEREGIIEQRRVHLTAGATTISVPITEALVPNAFISVLVARGRSAPPGPLDDPGRPTIRVGYAELRVLPAVKRLTVAVEPAAAEYRPGDSARIAVRVRDAGGIGRRAEVALWAVDEGVLALTGYKTPDPLAMLYAERGVGMRLASNLTAVAPQVPEGEKGRRSPGGGGGADSAGVLRSQFQSTAFFLTSIVTDSTGRAVAAAKLPDNLTTFRVMAVAATAGDRYGSGASSMLVTRPLLIRPALPRFVRGGDAFTAGGVVNRRSGDGDVRVTASVTGAGAELRGSTRQVVSVAAGPGVEVRFPFRVPTDTMAIGVDTVAFTFGVRASTARYDADRVLLRLPVRPDYAPRARTIAGVMRDTATVRFELPAGTDAARSRLLVSGGSSVMTVVRGAARELRVYPYDCSEQVVSAARPLLALYRASQVHGSDSVAVMGELRTAITVLGGRQRSDGGIGLWSADDWTTPYLTAYAGSFLLDAREAGFDVDQRLILEVARYLRSSAASREMVVTPVASWTSTTAGSLGERVAAVDYLRRAGRADVGLEDELVRERAQIWPVDRARLAGVIARRPGSMAVARELLAPEWAMARVEGARATFPDSAMHEWYFDARSRLPAAVLVATMAVDPSHPLIGPLVETLVEQHDDGWWWTTQDAGAAVEALAEFAARQKAALDRGLVVRSGNRVVARVGDGDSTATLVGLMTRSKTGETLTLSLSGGAGTTPLYYYVTVDEVPSKPPVTPDDAGIRVERWYERYDTRAPTTSVAEGDLVRVRLRITVPTDRPFVVLDDPLPAGLEAIDLSLATTGVPAGPAAADAESTDLSSMWAFGMWDGGWWSPFDHRELRDDRVVYVASYLWAGTYSASYVARATTPGVFVRPPAVAEEMYNRAVQGRTDGGVFTVVAKRP
jgi:alpha-2-macroglobulin